MRLALLRSSITGFPLKRGSVISLTVLVALTLLAYAPILGGAEKVWDDEALFSNPLLTDPAGIFKIWLQSRSNPFEEHYWPVTYTVGWVLGMLGMLRPGVVQLLNILLHCVSAGVLLTLAQRFGPKAQVGAFLFALHPIQVESVAWAIELKNTLSMFLALTSLWLYLRFERRSQYALALALGWGAFLAALLAKTAVLPWPVVVALLFWFDSSTWQRYRAVFVVGLFGLAAGMGLADTIYMAHGPRAVPTFTLLERLAIAGGALTHYLTKWLWPTGFCAIYPRWPVEGAALYRGLASFTVATAVAFFLLRQAWKCGRASALCVWIVGTLAMLSPTLGFVSFSYQRQSFVADRFAYHASAVFFPGLAALLLFGAERVLGKAWLRRTSATVILLFMTALTFSRSSVWVRAERLARDTVAKNPRAWTARYWLADALARRGALNEATDHFALVFWGSLEDFSAADLSLLQKSFQQEPVKSPKEAFNRGLFAARSGKLGEAREYFHIAGQEASLRAQAHLAISAIEWKLGDSEKAREQVAELYRVTIR